MLKKSLLLFSSLEIAPLPFAITGSATSSDTRKKNQGREVYALCNSSGRVGWVITREVPIKIKLKLKYDTRASQ